jgi:hypothetical protein
LLRRIAATVPGGVIQVRRIISSHSQKIAELMIVARAALLEWVRAGGCIPPGDDG